MESNLTPLFLSIPSAARILGLCDETLRVRLSDGRVQPDAFVEIGTGKQPMPVLTRATIERIRQARGVHPALGDVSMPAS